MGSQNMIDFARGCPSPRLVPTRAIDDASRDLLAQPDIAQRLMYGPDAGEEHVRESVARWLTNNYQPTAGSITVERLAITNGASNALSSILQVCTDPQYTRAVWIVEPTYFLARKIWLDVGFGQKMRAVPDSGDGIDLDFWRQGLERVDREAHERQIATEEVSFKNDRRVFPKLYRHILYLVPTNSNPTGHTMGVDTRRLIVEIAREFGVLVIADDVYDFLRWQGEGETEQNATSTRPPPRIVDIDRTLPGTRPHGNVVSNGSFSKIVAPGLRVGWVEGAPAFIELLEANGATQSGGCQSQFTSMVIEVMLSSGQITRHLEEVLMPTYRRRYHSMTCAIREHLYPLGIRMMHDLRKGAPASWVGGYFFYIVFPQNTKLPISAEIARLAKEEQQICIAPGDMFEVVKSDSDETRSSENMELFRRGARLCWAWEEEEELVEGVKRLAKLIKGILHKPSGQPA